MAKTKINNALKILLVTNAPILVAVYMLGPIYALFVEDIGGSFIEVGITYAFFAIAAGITSFFAGKYVDNVDDQGKVLALGYAGMGLSFLLYIFVHSIEALIAVQICLGVARAITSPAFDALYSKHLDGGKFATEWGIWETMNYFILAAGALVGGVIGAFLGFFTLFIVMAVLCLGSSAYILFLPKKAL